MTWIEAALLGLVQGLTEFLPVSSSGHLALGRILFGDRAESSALFEVVVHLGTLGSIFVVFRAEIAGLAREIPRLLRPLRWREDYAAHESFRLLILVGLSAIPAGILGLTLKDQVTALFDQPVVVGCCLLGTAGLLFASRFCRAGERRIDLRVALSMGLVQALALLPGISRSGATITAGLAAGGERSQVGRFAFLMAIIPIAGAGLLEAKDALGSDAPALPVVALLLGAAVSFLSGWFALRVLLRFVDRGALHWFAGYCLAVGLVAIFLI